MGTRGRKGSKPLKITHTDAHLRTHAHEIGTGHALPRVRRHDTANFELFLFRKDGSRVDVILNAYAHAHTHARTHTHTHTRARTHLRAHTSAHGRSCRKNYEGRIVGVLGVGQDVTDLKRVHKELRTAVHTHAHAHAL